MFELFSIVEYVLLKVETEVLSKSVVWVWMHLHISSYIVHMAWV